MPYTRTIGLVSAILININIIIGGGAFINAGPLIHAGGSASFVAYLAAALCLFPVVIVLAALARKHPESGGLYVYVRTYLHPFIAFLTGWGYFAGKSISVGLNAYVFIRFLKLLAPELASIPDIALVAVLVGLFVVINIAGAELQGKIQYLFVGAKALPILCVIGLFLRHANTASLSCTQLNGHALGALLPIAVFAMVGFEATCTLGHLFKNPEYTVIRALLYGFGLAVTILASFQLAVGMLLSGAQLSVHPVISIAHRYAAGLSGLVPLLYACMYTSMLGGAFSILTSNCWNLHRLAEQGHLPFRRWLIKTTRRQVPWVSLIVGAVISVLGVAITTNQAALQSMAIFGMIFAFCCTMIAGMRAQGENGARLVSPLIQWSAFGATGLLMYFCLVNIAQVGVSLPYCALVGGGIVLAVGRSFRQRIFS